jgi:hypothetical protein
MKVRHEIDDSILLPKPKQLILAATVVAMLAGGIAVSTPKHDDGRKMLHDAYRVTQSVK